MSNDTTSNSTTVASGCTAPDRVLEAFCMEVGVDLITVMQPLRAHNDKTDLYWPIDRHMTARGHEIVASVLADRLTPIIDQIWEQHTTRRGAINQSINIPTFFLDMANRIDSKRA
jgi:hypothetical protein